MSNFFFLLTSELKYLPLWSSFRRTKTMTFKEKIKVFLFLLILNSIRKSASITNCSLPSVDPCAARPLPCDHDGDCISCTDGGLDCCPHGYRCTCKEPWEGKHCNRCPFGDETVKVAYLEVQPFINATNKGNETNNKGVIMSGFRRVPRSGRPS
jgi:hypothetical protein